ncbi:hypothetical protein [Streptodolium elevatio]|uniref:Uncharacterized protein n=1 Tax=Streptodolium elevatio TaxID=3157996 RepID=A0ABV3DWA7_9ACTN
MSKIKSAATAAACAVGLTVGAFAMAGPAAAAGTGDAIYDCYLAPNGPPGTPDYNDVDVSFERDGSGNLTLFTSFTSPIPGVAITATTYYTSQIETGINGTAGAGPVVLSKSGSTAAYPSAPTRIKLVITPPGAEVNCYLVSATGFPL